MPRSDDNLPVQTANSSKKSALLEWSHDGARTRAVVTRGEDPKLSEIPELSDDEWAELVERLSLYADSKLRKLYWRGLRIAQGGTVPGGVRPEDLAAEAITSFLEGTRHWNQEKQPEFLRFLMSIIDSKVSTLVEGLENRVTRRIDTTDRRRNPLLKQVSSAKRPDTIVAEEEVRNRTRTAILKEIDGDEMVEQLFECLEAEIDKPAEIAQLLDVDKAEVNNAQKRLRRATDKACKKLGSSKP